MYYKCFECGHVFEEGEEAIITEDHGEKFRVCPSCHCEFGEAKRCKVCGNVEHSFDLGDGLCESCIEDIKMEYKYDIKKCFDLGEKEKHSVKINSFLASMFSVEQIEEILFKDLLVVASLSAVDCTPFIEADKSWFVEQVSKEVKK